MTGIGTLLNIIAVLLGTAVGTRAGAALPPHMRATIFNGLGLFTIALGLQMFLKTANPLVVLCSLLLGGLLGEAAGIDSGLHRAGAWLEARFSNSTGDTARTARFVKGFVTASLLFCVGPMAALGSLQDGLRGDYTLLAIKSVLDGFAALAFASTLGVGVAFSVITIFIYQGALTLGAAQIQFLLTEPMINEMTAVGGLMVMAIGVGGLLELRPMRTGSLIPAILLAPLLVALLAYLNPLLLALLGLAGWR